MKRALLALLLTIAALLALSGCAGASSNADTPTIAFDAEPGIYPARFKLTLTVSDPELAVYYTIDSSLPSPDSKDSKLYTDDGIEINYRGGGANDPSSVNIIRCAAFDSEGNRVGKTLTGTYILADLPEVRYSTMIVSVVCEPDDLYGYERGILVPGKIRDDFLKNRPASWTNDSLQDANFFRSGIEWERPAHIEFYAKSGEQLLSQDGGIRVSGGWNRNNSHKSLRIFARYGYDDSNVFALDAYPGLTGTTGVPVNAFKTLILRTGSNNLWNTTIQTQFLMQLGAETGLDTMNYRPVCVYVNGSYYGYMALFEDYSTTYFETNYNVPKEYVTCINGAGYIDGRQRAWQLDTGPDSDLREFKRMMNYIISLDMREEKFYKRAAEMLDFDNFIRYMCFQGYIANSDWPQNNVRLWRYNGGVGAEGYDEKGYNPNAEDYGFDGRWRFLLKDLDLSSGYGDNVADSIFKRLDSDDGGLRLNAMFRSLFRNNDFKNRVYCFLCDLLSTTMDVENVMSKLGEVEASALTEMRYYTRSTGASGGSNEKWHEHLLTPSRFFVKRHDNVAAELEKKYGSKLGTLTVNIEGEGTLGLSTLTLDSDCELKYLGGLKIHVSAEPAEGWRLASLKLSGSDIGESFTMRSGGASLTAVFEPDPDYAEPVRGVIFNEVKYESPRSDDSSDLLELYNAGDGAVYLKGWSIIRERTEAGEVKRKEYDLPAVSLGADEYITIACDKGKVVYGSYHAPFGLSAGDTLILRDRLGNVLDSLTLPVCNNFTPLARDGDEWYYEPTGTFGAANVRAEGYRLADVIDERAFGVFIHKGKFIEDFAEETERGWVITKRSICDNLGSDKFEKYQSKFKKLGDGYELDSVLEAMSYKRWYIESLDSYVIFKK